MLNSRKISPTQIQLTPNGLHEILSKSANGVIVQVISSEVINTQNGIKYKIIISDGFAKHVVVFGNQAAKTFQMCETPNFCIVRLNEVVQAASAPKRIIIVTHIDVLDAQHKETIGFPIDYQEWLTQVQQYEDFQSNSISKPFSLDEKSNNNLHRGNSGPNLFPIEEKPSSPFQKGPQDKIRPYPFEELQNKNFKNYQQKNPNVFPLEPPRENSPHMKENPRIEMPKFKQASHLIANEKNKPQHPPQSKPIENNNFRSAPLKEPEVKSQHNLTTTSESESESEVEALHQNKIPQVVNPAKKQESNLSSERVIKKLISFPVLGINVRDFEDSDCEQFHQSVGVNQVFSIDFFDKEGNKVSAVLYGEKAEQFCSVLKSHQTHILSNIQE